MSSSSSSSQSQVSDDYWRRHGEASSPIPYREGPLQYTPTVMCKCGQKAAQFISWSNKNPGLRYLKCARARDGGCDFYRFVDPPTSGFLKQLLLDLRDAVKYWKRHSGEAERRLDFAAMEYQRLQAQLEAVAMEKQRVQAELQAGILQAAATQNQRVQDEMKADARENEDRRALFVHDRTNVARLEADLEDSRRSKAQLEIRIGTMEEERKMLLCALLVCIGLVASSHHSQTHCRSETEQEDNPKGPFLQHFKGTQGYGM